MHEQEMIDTLINGQLSFLYLNKWIINSKFVLEAHVPNLESKNIIYDLIFIGDNGISTYKKNIQNNIESIKIDLKLKTGYISWSE